MADVLPNYVMKATCVRVKDGDTAVFNVSPAFKFYWHEMDFRFYGINTPELKSKVPATAAKARKALEYVKAAIEGKEIMLQTIRNPSQETEKIDKYGRYLAIVYYKNSAGLQVNLNEELIELGLAKEYYP